MYKFDSQHRKKLGAFLKDRRVDVGLSQKSAAAKLRLKGAQFVSNIERGVCSTPLYLLREMVVLYRIRESDLLPMIAAMQHELLQSKLYGRQKAVAKKR